MFSALFVEDDTAIREVMTQELYVRGFAARGFEILAAGNAYEAIRILGERDVDVLFTDIIMPGMDGVQLASQAKLIRPGIKVLFATAYAMKAFERRAIQQGRILYKPVRQLEIVQALEHLVAA
ncbi:MAG TPA: response regulator [Stellaceae bacterium]|nr:response regulator [Stellaceae bacterium]